MANLCTELNFFFSEDNDDKENSENRGSENIGIEKPNSNDQVSKRKGKTGLRFPFHDLDVYLNLRESRNSLKSYAFDIIVPDKFHEKYITPEKGLRYF